MESEVARLPDELVESIMRDAVGVVNSAARLVGIDDRPRVKEDTRSH